MPGQADGNAAYDVFVYQGTAKAAPAADFDGDGDTDVAMYRPSSGY